MIVVFDLLEYDHSLAILFSMRIRSIDGSECLTSANLKVLDKRNACGAEQQQRGRRLKSSGCTAQDARPHSAR
ncbi:hypothetical protein RB195_016159 [Necator americanus]|uniref:Uncharacterized protein n=1 Tax=Necator americanus TaxID=51031 RepID=A0ABR1E7V3_NECAM